MNTYRLRGWFSTALMAVALTCAATASARFSEFPAPTDARLEVVGLDMRLNGIRMSAWEMHSERQPQSVLDFYIAHWGTRDRERPGYTLVPMGDWQLFTHIDERQGLIYTVQIRPEGAGAFALLGVSDMLAGKGKPPAELARDFPGPGGSTFESVLEADEIGWKARTITLSNKRSVTANVEHYVRQLESQGWLIEQAVQARSGEAAIAARRNRDSLAITVFPQDGVSRTIAVWEER